MFAKLLKHDFKANAGLLGLLSGCSLALGCLAAVVLRLLTTHWDIIMAKDEYILLLIPAFLFLFQCILTKITQYYSCVGLDTKSYLANKSTLRVGSNVDDLISPGYSAKTSGKLFLKITCVIVSQ